MGTFADSLFTVLMSWVRGLVNGIWALFTSDHTTLLEFLGKNWMVLAAVMIGAGLVIDWVIWLLRWQPYHLWAQRARRLLRIEEPEEEEAPPAKAHAAVMPRRKTQAQLDQTMEIEPFVPMSAPIDESQEEEILEQASNVPDEYAYPGMRYDSPAPEEMGSTQRYGAVTQEGPGAAEVRMRKAEIEAWQLQMQEEARARAEAERLQREAYEVEQARLAKEAYEAEQARLAQAEYERQMAEYERQKAQYERDLAEYERQKAEYEAELARQAAMQETAAEIEPQQWPEETIEPEMASVHRRRRGMNRTYDDHAAEAIVDTLTEETQLSQMDEETNAAPEKTVKHHKLLDRMAKMIEAEDEQLSGIRKLPPRVNMQDAYMPAAAPRKPGRRSRKA